MILFLKLLFLSLVREAGVCECLCGVYWTFHSIALHVACDFAFICTNRASIDRFRIVVARCRCRHQTHFIQGSEFFYELLQWELIFSLSFLPSSSSSPNDAWKSIAMRWRCLRVNTFWAERNEMTRRQELCWSWGDMSTINIRHRKRNKTLNFCPIPK